MQTVSYSKPQLCSYGGDTSNAWFVYFEVTNPQTGECQRKQFRSGINYWPDAADRQKAGEALVKHWEKKLKAGWHPVWKVLVGVPESLATMTFAKALQFSLSKYKASKGTKRAYTTAVTYVIKAATALQIAGLPAAQIRRQHIMLILDYCTTKLGWSNAAHNKNLGYLHAVLEKLITWEVIEFNPSQKIELLPVAETQKFIPYTQEEKEAIQEHLFIHHYAFYVYLMVIYHTGIRPKEVLALRIQDVDLAKKRITIVPDLDEENSKTKKIRLIPLNDHLLPFLRELQLHSFDKSFFVFGSPYGPNGNRGLGSEPGHVTGASRPDYFRPSTTRIKRDTATKLWKKIVWKGLGIEKYQYAMKHTGGDDKILAGMDMDALKELYGHSSKFMTEKYASKIKELRAKHIVEHSPAFISPKVSKE